MFSGGVRQSLFKVHDPYLCTDLDVHMKVLCCLGHTQTHVHTCVLINYVLSNKQKTTSTELHESGQFCLLLYLPGLLLRTPCACVRARVNTIESSMPTLQLRGVLGWAVGALRSGVTLEP